MTILKHKLTAEPTKEIQGSLMEKRRGKPAGFPLLMNGGQPGKPGTIGISV
jgi:hypothetical protein